MLYIIWGLLNLALLVFFCVVCYRAATLLRANYNWFSAVVFVFGFVSFCGTPDRDGAKPREDKNTSMTAKNWVFAKNTVM